HAVDHDPAGPQPRGHAAHAGEVGAENGWVQAIPGVLGDPTRVILGIVGDDADHRAERLFAGDRHVVLHIDEHRGLHEVARFETLRVALVTDQHLGAFFNALTDAGLHTLVGHF